MLFRFLAPLRAHTDTALVALLGPLSLCLPLWAHPAPVCPPPRAAACCDCSLQAMSRRRLATCRLWSGCQRATSPPPCPRRWAWRGEHRWTGVPLRHLVELLGGGERSRIVLTALNDYAVEIPWSDLLRYNPVLAYRRDGQRMGIRDKGALILISPFDAHPALQQGQDYVNRTI